ncbi:MAG: hypothetical protein CFE40_05080 [Burkholderiales bacterium PBB1]|nr:MAG: hypothetical protein CFE40_05080 [Burkholderiales bacterium PBB1]
MHRRKSVACDVAPSLWQSTLLQLSSPSAECLFRAGNTDCHEALDGAIAASTSTSIATARKLPMTTVKPPHTADVVLSTPASSAKEAIAGRHRDGLSGTTRDKPLIAAAAAGMIGLLLARRSR